MLDTFHKKGFQRNRIQKYRCTVCKKYQQASYAKKAYQSHLNSTIITLVKEGCGIRSIARILQIAVNTVIKRIRMLASKICKPDLFTLRKSYEVDELST